LDLSGKVDGITKWVLVCPEKDRLVLVSRRGSAALVDYGTFSMQRIVSTGFESVHKALTFPSYPYVLFHRSKRFLSIFDVDQEKVIWELEEKFEIHDVQVNCNTNTVYYSNDHGDLVALKPFGS